MSTNKEDLKDQTEATVLNPVQKIVIQIQPNPSLKDAVEASVAWFDAEHRGLGSFYDRMELSNYSEWACRKSIGQDVGEYKGVPRLILSLNPEAV